MMGSYPVLFVFCIVFSLAVNSGDAVPRPTELGNYRPNGALLKPLPFNGVLRKAGARGLIGDDVSWLAMLPLNAIETFINIPLFILQTVANFTNKALRYFVAAEVVDLIELSLYILFLPMRILWWVITFPIRIVWFFITVPFRLFTWTLDIVQIVIQHILGLFYGLSYGSPNQVNVLNRFLKGDIFGPIGRGIEELLLDIYHVFHAITGWMFSSGAEVAARRQQVVATLSDTLGHMIKTNRMLREAF